MDPNFTQLVERTHNYNLGRRSPKHTKRSSRMERQTQTRIQNNRRETGRERWGVMRDKKRYRLRAGKFSLSAVERVGVENFVYFSHVV